METTTEPARTTRDLAQQCRRAAAFWLDCIETMADAAGAAASVETIAALLDVAERHDPSAPPPGSPWRYTGPPLLIAERDPPEDHNGGAVVIVGAAERAPLRLPAGGLPDWIKPGHRIRVVIELIDAAGPL